MSVYSNPYGGTENEGVHTPPASSGYDPKKSSAYNTNYVLTVINIMNSVGLQPLENTMETESELMDVTAEMQSDLTTIQEYLTRLENLSHSGGAWKMDDGKWSNMPPGQKGWFGPNADNGIAYNEFHESPDTNNPNNYYVSSDFKNATDGFISAMKDLFVGQGCSEGDPSASSNFVKFSVVKPDKDGNPIVQNFDLTSTFNQLNSNQSGWGMMQKSTGESVFSNSSTHSASLIQQYAYYQYKLSAEQYHGLVPDADVSKLGISLDPTQSNCDGIAKSMFGLLNSFNTEVTVDRENDGDHRYNAQFSNTTKNFLYYIFVDPYEIKSSGSGFYIGGKSVNIFGAFSYAAFNYYWTQNPNGSTDPKDNTIPPPPPYIQPDGKPQGYKFDKDDKGVVADGDKLSTWYSTSQSSSSLLSSQANENSTTMQQYSSEVSQYQNIGQNIIKSSNENNIATVQNYKSG